MGLGHVCIFLLLLLYSGAHNSEQATSLCPCNGISRDQYIFRSSFLQILTISQHKPETHENSISYVLQAFTFFCHFRTKDAYTYRILMIPFLQEKYSKTLLCFM